jgi:hypothetical protein
VFAFLEPLWQAARGDHSNGITAGDVWHDLEFLIAGIAALVLVSFS